jgi:hypothetical protein
MIYREPAEASSRVSSKDAGHAYTSIHHRGCAPHLALRRVAMTTLAASDRERLARLLGMLGSDHAGERDNAARAAHRLVQQHGITWFDLVVMPPPPDMDDPYTDPIGADWRRMATACCRYPHLLNRWEASFLAGLPRFPRLSTKQRSALLKIAVRLRACGCSL